MVKELKSVTGSPIDIEEGIYSLTDDIIYDMQKLKERFTGDWYNDSTAIQYIEDAGECLDRIIEIKAFAKKFAKKHHIEGEVDLESKQTEGNSEMGMP